MLGFEEDVEAFKAVQPAEPAGLIASCFSLGEKAVVAIHPDGTGFQSTGGTKHAGAISAPNTGCETPARGVCARQRLGFVAEAFQRNDRAEQFILDQRAGDVLNFDQCRRQVMTFGCQTGRHAALDQRIAAQRFDDTKQPVTARPINHWPHLRRRISGSTDLE